MGPVPPGRIGNLTHGEEQATIDGRGWNMIAVASRFCSAAPGSEFGEHGQNTDNLAENALFLRFVRGSKVGDRNTSRGSFKPLGLLCLSGLLSTV